MVYVNVKQETEEKLHLSREPGNSSWAMLVGFCAFGFGAAYYGNDHILWKIVYLTLGVIVGISCIEDWEECEFNKKTGEVRLRKHSLWDVIFSPITDKEQVIVAHLPDVAGVRVEEKKVNYFGNTYQVVLVFSTGMALGITETFTFGSTLEHYKVADKIRTFLDLDNQSNDANIGRQTEISDADDDSSASEATETDDFEQIDKSELPEELAAAPPSQTPDIATDDKAKDSQ